MANTVGEHKLNLVLAEANVRLPKTKPYVLKTIKSAIDEAMSGKSVFCAGVPVKAKDIAQEDFLLPALLFIAARKLLLPNESKQRKIGFAFELTADQSSVLMFKVSNIPTSSPRDLKLAIISELRRGEKDGEISRNEDIGDFGDFIDYIFPEDVSLPDLHEKVFVAKI